MTILDFNLVFDTQIYIGLNKSDRLNYGDSLMNHAMLLTGVHIEVKEMEQGYKYILPFTYFSGWKTHKMEDREFMG